MGLALDRFMEYGPECFYGYFLEKYDYEHLALILS